jgi:glucans biosynthesis protein
MGWCHGSGIDTDASNGRGKRVPAVRSNEVIVRPVGLRSGMLGAAVMMAVALVAAAPEASSGFSLEDVAKKAESLAEKGFEDRSRSIPRWLLDISYDQWRDIRFKTDQSMWRSKGLPFELQFFHCGLYYDRSVKLSEVVGSKVEPIGFSPNQFDYGKNEFGSRIPQDLGYAGFRVHYPINKPGYKDEVIVFVGASYFRAVAKDLVYGQSARGLAVDTALPTGEEFPYFREFWLVRPAKDAKSLVFYALLDSQRVTGAYKFSVFPGTTTKVEVESRLFARATIEKTGIAPLTSMFVCGEGASRCGDDYRPEIHDTDGLLMKMGSGEWIWRPLLNPQRLTVNSFFTANPRGFGLLQRDRDFDHYQDIETRQELRPGLWIEPKGDWGAGHVELIQIPTDNEINDNMVAFWVPSTKLEPGKPAAFAYAMHWGRTDPARGADEPAGRVVSSRVDGMEKQSWVRFTVDFESPELAKLAPETVVRGVVATMGGGEGMTILEQQVLKVPYTDAWRLVFKVPKAERQAAELRATLEVGEKTLTETWTYTLEP